MLINGQKHEGTVEQAVSKLWDLPSNFPNHYRKVEDSVNDVIMRDEYKKMILKVYGKIYHNSGRNKIDAEQDLQEIEKLVDSAETRNFSLIAEINSKIVKNYSLLGKLDKAIERYSLAVKYEGLDGSEQAYFLAENIYI